ncbi:hypothetical protein HDF24_10595 [Mucilaginibacter sp. X4EP1]|jgi:hypothetical protein|uniref:hypothetical protein n=1 Tax=Mucilaginibacter sp. X4EP1 TaxID=2723092 RepID=UPI00216A4D0D|nr:hypothetical protein [Mucilaginibacter sp. X4EP1]MCS3815656.1 hypothetical protein [Mucilaginibacter sp. X4EP1]
MRKKEDNLSKSIFQGVLNSFFSIGLLNSEDLLLSKEDLLIKFKSIVDKTEIGITVDYRAGILNQADTFWSIKKYDFAKVFYAMFFEHSLNGVMENICSKKKLDEKTKNDIIRSIDIHGKLTWFPKLIGFRSFNINHIKTIKKLTDDRNAFVHYKWKSTNDEINSSEENRIIEEHKKIKLAIRYMKTYESHILYQKNKKRINDKINKSDQ